MPGTTYNWTGTLGGDWGTGADWSGRAVPNSTGVSATIASAGSYVVDIAAGEHFTIGGLTLAVGPTLDVLGTLVLGGTLAGPGTIDIGQGGTVSLDGVVGGASIADLGLVSDSSGLLVLDGPVTGGGESKNCPVPGLSCWAPRTAATWCSAVPAPPWS